MLFNNKVVVVFFTVSAFLKHLKRHTYKEEEDADESPLVTFANPNLYLWQNQNRCTVFFLRAVLLFVHNC